MKIKSVDGALMCIEGNDAKILINPTKDGIKKHEPQIVLTTNDSEKLKEKDGFKLFDWPGEYESKGVLVHSISHMKDKKEIRTQSMEIDGIRVCVLAEITENPSKKVIAEFGNVDVLVLSSELKASDMMVVIEEVDPYQVILLNNYNSGDPEWSNMQAAIKETGEENMEGVKTIEIKGKDYIDNGSLDYFLLDC
jgi:hypothetical protein